MKRPSELSNVDLAIIGGGINGAGLAVQAAQAGLSVVLFEKGDFASGTSSKSTKLIHGGIRYLEHGAFPLVFEALHERRHLLETAPHLVRPIPFLLPSYKGEARPAWLLKLGLWLYDLLAGSHNLAHHQWFSPREALEKAPSLNPVALKGCGLYYDAQVNDARLVLENILAAESAGASCFNYCRVIQVGQHGSNTQVFYRDEISNQSGVLTASCLVNASGPWANQTAKLLDTDALRLVRPTRGTHIVVPQVLTSHAVLVTTQTDNRVIFIIPWRGYSLVGTTDLDDPEDPDQVKPTEAEIQYLLSEASRVFPQYSWTRKNVIAAFAGLRPLAWSAGQHTSSVSREDRIIRSGRNLAIVGGKLTTYQAMAQKTLNLVLDILGKKPLTASRQILPGTPEKPWIDFIEEDSVVWITKYGIKEHQALHLANLYGKRAIEILELTKKDQLLLEPLHPDRPEIMAQVQFAVENEKAFHLNDVLLRRLEIGYSPQRWGEAAEKASRLMAKLLKWNEMARQKELENYKQTLYPSPV